MCAMRWYEDAARGKNYEEEATAREFERKSLQMRIAGSSIFTSALQAAAQLTTSSSFAFIHISLLILYISSHMPSYLGQQHQQPRAYRGITRTLQSTRTSGVEGERSKRALDKKVQKIFCAGNASACGMRKRPKKVVSARNCFPFKVDHKTYVDKLSWVSAAMPNVCWLRQTAAIDCVFIVSETSEQQ